MSELRNLLAEVAPRWAAVVVNYNAGPLLVDCVRSVVADTSAGVSEVIVVDNQSTDGSIEALRLELLHGDVRNVEIILTGMNLGYARAANLGTAATSAPIVAVLNPDTLTALGTAAAMLARFDEDDGLGVVGPRVYNTDGSVYPSARRMPPAPIAVGHGILKSFWPTNPFTRSYRETDLDSSVPREVDWVSGAAIWLRRTALDEIGGWDERYFMYVEDVDLCWRMRGRGWRVAYDPGGSVEHVQGASTARVPYRMIAEHHRSLWRFAERRWRGPRRALLPAAAAFLGGQAALSMGHHAASAWSARRRGVSG